MISNLFVIRASKVALLASCFLFTAFAQVNVLTNRYNQARTAANINETQLTQANVNTASFGKLGKYSVDGAIYAQPLYVQNVMVNGAPHNVLYVGTMHDVLYAFDADNIGSLPLWTIDFRNLAAGITPAPIHIGVGDGTDASVADTFGIFGTPVIDLPNNRMFFVTHTLENGTECFRLRQVDIRTGTVLNSTLITGSVPATNAYGSATFIPSKYGQRPALELVSGQVWVAFGSRPTGDYTNPWQGWVMTYNANTLAQSGVFATSRTNGNSIWQSGSGPVVDAAGKVYYLTGNGGGYDGLSEFPMTLLQMSYGTSLGLNNWYTPDSGTGTEDYTTMDNWDLDLSCNGPLLIPGTDLVTFGSKTADVFLLHTGNLGKLTPNDTQLAQFFHVGAPTDYTQTDSDRIVGMAYWQGPSGGTLYVWPGLDALHAYTLNAATATFTQSYAGTVNLVGQPGTALAVSANGSTSGTGILWAPVMITPTEQNIVGYPGVLHAYNAENPAQELWNSSLVSSDNMGTLPKFVPPVVANGKVYMANSASVGDYGAGSVTVYGLKADLSAHVNPYVTLTAPGNAATIVAGSNVTLTATAHAGSSPVASVSFLDGATVLGTVAQPPYTFTLTSPAVGSHTLTAVATDTAGAVTTAVPATVNVVASQTYTLSASPSSLVLPPGGSISAVITFNPLNGFSGGSTSVYATGLPAGVSDSWAQNASGNSYTLTLTAAASVASGTSTLTLISGAGGQPNSLLLPLTISASAFAPGTNSVTFNIPSGVTALGTPVVFTEGVPSTSLANPDFSLVSNGTTCSGPVSGSSCTVNVQFAPHYAGLRRGAVNLVDTNNNVLATSYFFGTGPGSATPLAGTQATVYSGYPHGVAVDGAGNVYVVDIVTNQISKITPGGTQTPVALAGAPLNVPFGLALDAAGNLFIANTNANQILELPYGSSTATALNISGLNFPQGVAVDGAGNLFIANTRGTATSGNGTIIEVPAGGTGTPTTVLASGLNFPSGVALDASGDLFIADSYNNRVLELAAGGTQTSIGANLGIASAVAVDSSGDVFITDATNNQLVEVQGTSTGPGSGAQSVVATGLVTPYGLALDEHGDAFVVNFGSATASGSIVEILSQAAQTITFAPIGTQTAGTTLALSATASSGLTVTFASSTPAVCTISGANANLIGTGTCTIVASQAGNSSVPPALQVSQSFSVVAHPQTINFPPISEQTLGTSLALSATATSGLPVSFSSTTPAICTVSGTTATFLSSGSCLIVASQAGNAIYLAATPLSQQFTVVGIGETLASTFTIPSGVTLGTPVVFTEGVPSSSLGNPDFTLASSTCSASATGTCSVAVRFTPQQAGLRRGAIKLVDNNNNVLATSYISGIGPDASGVWAAGASTKLYNTGYPHGVAVDGAGDVFVMDTFTNQVFKIAPGGSPTAVALGVTLSSPFGLALDGAGNLYIADAGNNRVLELPYGSSTASALNLSGLNFPEGLAVDGAGNLYVANTRANASTGNGNIIELAAGTGIQSTAIGGGLSYPSGVAVDAAGDIFVADWGNNRVLEQSVGGVVTSIGTGIANASAVAVDAAGDVFIADENHNQLVEVPGTVNGPGTGTQVTVATGLVTPYGLALDGQGNVYVVNVGAGATAGSILEIQRAIGVTFTPPSGATLGTPVVFTEGVPSSTLPNPDFTLLSNGCTGAVTGSCTVAVQFTAQQPGLRRGAVKLVDSNNNVLATSYISGVGANSLPAWTPGTTKTVYAPSKGFPRGVTVDGGGNAFVLDTYSNQVFKVTPSGSSTALALGTTLSSPYGLALDAAGNLYIADAGNNRVLELPYGAGSATALNVSGLNSPEGLAVDGAGNLLIANTKAAATSGTGTIIKLATGGATQSTILAKGLNFPSGVAVDAAGDIFIADRNNNRVLEVPLTGAAIAIGSGLSNATAVAVDAAGDVFIVDENHNQLVEVPATAAGPGSGAQVTVASGLLTPYAVSLDGQGDAFVANVGGGSTSGNVVEILRAGAVVPQPQTITFGPLTPQSLGSSPTLTATASSGLTVVFTSTTPAVCTASGNSATLLATGTCTIVASQPGSSAYLAAMPVDQSFTVLGAGQTEGATFTIPAGVTLGTPIVFTEGVPSSSLAKADFTLSATGTTCVAGATGTCAVSVQFTPQFAGLRRGAIKLVDNNNNVLATSYISGIGPNTLPAWTSSVSKTIYQGSYPRGVTVDGAGDLFITDTLSNKILKLAPGATTPQTLTLGLTLSSPYGLALDAAGNLYIADAGNNRVVELPYNSSSAVALNVAGLVFPEGLAVDGSGNLFIANTHATAASGTGTVVEVAAVSGTLTTVASSGLNNPSGVALDAAGDVFIADKSNNRVLEIPISGNPVSIGTGISGASVVAVDAAGDVFIADQNNGRIVEVPGTAMGPGTGTQATVATGLVNPYGIALDGYADLFVANVGGGTNTGSVVEVQVTGATAQTITFGAIATQTVGTSFNATATASSGLAVSFSSSTPAVCTVSGTAVTLLTSGVCTITASQPGNNIYAAASPVSQSFTVNPLPQTITFAAVAAQPAGTTLALSASATSGLPVTFASSTANVCTVSGNSATLLIAGTCTINASQAGSNIYAAATPVSQSFSVTAPVVSAGTYAALAAGTNSLTFSVKTAGVLGTPVLFTEGAPSTSLASPDFTLVPGSTTCSGLVSGTSCTVGVQFKPAYAGLRRGAVKLFDSNGNLLTTAFIYGVGPGTQTALASASLNTIANTGSPRGVAVDGLGDVFYVDNTAAQVYKVAPGGAPVAVALGLTLNSPFGVAVDAAGNLYISDSSNNRILKLPYGSSVATPLNLSGITFPQGLAIDGSGNLFIANTRGAATSGRGSVVKVAAGTLAQTTLIAAGLGNPSAVAVDASGDVFFADWSNNRVVELPAGGGASRSIGSGLNYAAAVAVDAAGDVFIGDEANNRVVKVPGTATGPGTGTQVVVATGLSSPYSLAFDGQGDLFIANVGSNGTTNGSVVEIPTLVIGTTPQSITFGAIAAQTAATTLSLTATATSGLPVSFTSSTASVCTVSGTTATLLTQGTCTITASQAGNSTYAAASPVSQSFTVNLAAQSITFSAIATQTAATTLTLSASATSGLPVSFASSTASVCTVAGTTANLLTQGTCTITASQAGNSTYAAAASVPRSFTVNPHAQTITFAAPATQTVGTPLTLSATASSGLGVTFASTTTSICTVSGTTATFVAAGTCGITASQGGNSTYAAATPVSQSFTVNSAVITTPVSVSLASAFNVHAIFNNGTAPTNGGIDGTGYAYSSSLLGTSVTWSSVPFTIGAVGAADAVYGSTISLPAGAYPTLKLLATGLNGEQTNQTFVVTYTDGTTSTFVQSLSDWGAESSISSESIAVTMTYRLIPSGATQNGPWHLYGYSFTLNTTKTVKSITLPNNRNVVVLAITL